MRKVEAEIINVKTPTIKYGILVVGGKETMNGTIINRSNLYKYFKVINIQEITQWKINVYYEFY